MVKDFRSARDRFHIMKIENDPAFYFKFKTLLWLALANNGRQRPPASQAGIGESVVGPCGYLHSTSASFLRLWRHAGLESLQACGFEGAPRQGGSPRTLPVLEHCQGRLGQSSPERAKGRTTKAARQEDKPRRLQQPGCSRDSRGTGRQPEKEGLPSAVVWRAFNLQRCRRPGSDEALRIL